jgi:hypothetical protein
MNFMRFLLSQSILFLILLVVSTFKINNNFINNLIMNFLIFFTASFIIVFLLEKKSPVYTSVLSSTLSFNTVTYIISYASGASLPEIQYLIIDYIIVIIFTCIGTRMALSKKSIN